MFRPVPTRSTDLTEGWSMRILIAGAGTGGLPAAPSPHDAGSDDLRYEPAAPGGVHGLA
ncbi:hypothetical protein GCM10023079_52350 [Streptomyces chitinivorans]